MAGNIPYISREQTEALLNCFAEAIEKPQANPLLFNVWGIGGVGKTTLLDKLVELHPNISFTRVYFGSTPDIGTPLKLMAKLYDNLPATYDWGEEYERFPDLYQKYQQTLQQLEKPDKKESEAQAKDRKDAIKKLVGGSAKAISQVTPLKPVAGEVSLIAEGGVNLVDWLQKQRVTKRDKELRELMLEPIPKLTKAFVAGIIAKSQQQPVVLLLDTYEKTNSEIDNWLWQYLITNSDLKSHRVRIVVAGRKNLLKQEGWRKLQQDFNSVYSLEIERFTLEQTQNYFAKIDIANLEQIYQVTKGLPYYLNWIRKQKLAGKELDFSQGNQEIVNLLLQGLNKTQKKVIQLAACCRYCNQTLIKYLVTSQELDFDNEVDTKLNCFEWLTSKLDFVEFTQNTHRLDDVARDVFRLSLWQEDQDQFRQVNDLLAKYYEDKAIAEVSPDSSPPKMYKNREWQEYTSESLYHGLFAKQSDIENKFLTHLFCGCYLQDTEVVTIPFDEITSEINLENKEHNDLLSSTTKNFLQNIKSIFDVNCLAFEERKLINSLKNQELSLEQIKTLLKPALKYCFDRIDCLDGLAKFAALLYKAENSYSSDQLRYLQQAKSQAEKIIVNSDPEFSSGLFLWDLGGTQFNLGRYEEAISSYDKALEIKPDKDEAWYNRGVALANLGRDEDVIASYNKALEIKPDFDQTWYNRGVALGHLGRYEDALASYDQAVEIKPDNDGAWYNRGVTLGHLGRYEDEIASYDQALEIKPDKDEAWYNRACCFALQNQIQSAIENLAKAISLNNEYQEIAKTDTDFDNIREDKRFKALVC